jgi:hypothetical protein
MSDERVKAEAKAALKRIREAEYPRFFDQLFDSLTTDIRNLLQAEYWRTSPVMQNDFHHPALAALTFLVGTQIMRIRDRHDRQDAVERTMMAIRHHVRDAIREAEELDRQSSQH